MQRKENWDSLLKGKTKYGPHFLWGLKVCLKYNRKVVLYLECKFLDYHQYLRDTDVQICGFVKQL